MGVLSLLTDMISSRTAGQARGSMFGREVVATAFPSGHGEIANFTVEQMWASQPNLRTVVDFQARQISQLGLHVFTRDDADEATKRVRTGAVAETLRTPNPEQTLTELVYDLIGEFALYDRAYLWVSANQDGGRDLRVLPSAWTKPEAADSFRTKRYLVSAAEGSTPLEIPAVDVVPFIGWTPAKKNTGTSPVETLRLILEEQHHARTYRNQVWRKGGRFGGYLWRPPTAPAWTGGDRRRFYEMWRAFVGDNGERAGEEPMLEDGMEYRNAKIQAKDDQWAESVKLSLETCAQVYQINPTMVGVLDNANYSNVREFRRGLYGDTLGPLIRRIEDRFNTFVLPLLAAEPDQFVEFNVEGKLRGSFEEQADVVFKATGAPWQTINESRKLFNRPPVPGGDTLVTPLNMGELGAEPDADADAVEVEEIDPKTLRDVATKFLHRQRDSVTAKRAAGREDWWDGARWTAELAADLTATGLGEKASAALSGVINDRARQMYADGEFAPERALQGAGGVATWEP